MRCTQCRIRPATRAFQKWVNPKTGETAEVRSEFCSSECSEIHHESMGIPMQLYRVSSNYIDKAIK